MLNGCSRFSDTHPFATYSTYSGFNIESYKFGDLTKETMKRVAAGNYTLDDLFMLIKGLGIVGASLSPVGECHRKISPMQIKHSAFLRKLMHILFTDRSWFLAREAVSRIIELFSAQRRGGESHVFLGSRTRQAPQEIIARGRELQTRRCDEADHRKCSKDVHRQRYVPGTTAQCPHRTLPLGHLTLHRT